MVNIPSNPIQGESRLIELMGGKDLDAIALVPGANFRCLYGRNFHQNERALVVLIGARGEKLAVVPDLEAASFELVDFDGDVFTWKDNDGPAGAFSALGQAAPHLKRIGVEGQRMRVMEYQGLESALPEPELVDCHGDIASTLRLNKSGPDLERIRQAIGISEAALEATLGEIRIGQSETDIESLLLKNLFAAGSHGLAFDPIVAAADNSFRPHASARPDYHVTAGDALLIDFGGCFEGFSADITRTFFIGHCPQDARAQYETVLAANRAGREAARPGISAHDLDDIVLSVLERSPFAGFVRTKTGHGLGLDIHEDPYIMRGNRQTLEPGMVFTIEPGLYDPEGFGVRIEDDVVITADGVECLTQFDREIRIVA